MDSENTLLQSLISVSLCIKIASRRSDQRSVLCLFFHTLTLPSSCCGQNLDSSFNIMFLHPDSQYLGAPQAQKTRAKEAVWPWQRRLRESFHGCNPHTQLCCSSTNACSCKCGTIAKGNNQTFMI